MELDAGKSFMLELVLNNFKEQVYFRMLVFFFLREIKSTGGFNRQGFVLNKFHGNNMFIGDSCHGDMVLEG